MFHKYNERGRRVALVYGNILLQRIELSTGVTYLVSVVLAQYLLKELKWKKKIEKTVVAVTCTNIKILHEKLI